MDKTILYATLFLIACAAIAVLGMLQAYFRQKKIVQLLNAQDLLQTQLKTTEQSAQAIQSEMSALRAQIQVSDVDQATQLMAWRLFLKELQQQIKEAQRFNITMALLLIDIDDLTVIGNALNYSISDALFKEVAKTLTHSIREVDSISRYNETSFAILLSQIAKPETAVIVAQRILQTLKQPFFIEEHELYVTASIGISTYPFDAEEPEKLINCARHALDLAKMDGQHTYRFYQEDMHRDSQRELMLQTSMGKGIFNDDFMIYYQPILNSKTHKILCLDAIPYWYHAQTGNLNANELMHYAERYQKLDLLFEWLLKNICQDYTSWLQSGGITSTHLKLSKTIKAMPEFVGVPITIAQLQSHLIYRIFQIMQELKFDPQHLLLEVKSGAAPLSFDVLEKALNMLNYLKIKICITDFGQASLSLNYLKIMQPHVVKLDPVLITDIVNNKATRSLIESIIFMLQKMNIELIVTGVDTEEQFDLLQQLGVINMEGPFIGLPVAQTEIAKKVVTIQRF